jgi:hypothetical protein
VAGKDWNLLDPPFLLLQGYGEEVQHWHDGEHEIVHSALIFP